jgi:hypothetical protein
MTHFLDKYWDQILNVSVDIQPVVERAKDVREDEIERSFAMDEDMSERIEEHIRKRRELVDALLVVSTGSMPFRDCMRWMQSLSGPDDYDAVGQVCDEITEQVAEKFLTVIEDTDRKELQAIAHEAIVADAGLHRDKSDALQNFVSVYLMEKLYGE